MWPGLESRGRPTDVGWVSCSFSSILLQALRMVQNGWSREKKCLAPYLPPPFHFFVCCPDNILSLAYWLVFLLLRRPFFINWLIDWFLFFLVFGFLQHFQMRIRWIPKWYKKNHFVRSLPINRYLLVYLFMIYLFFTYYKSDGVLIIFICMKTSPSRNLNAPTGGSKDRPASVRSG